MIIGSRLYVRFVQLTNQQPIINLYISFAYYLIYYYVLLASPCIRIQNIEHAYLRSPDSIHRVDRYELRDYEQVTTWRHVSLFTKHGDKFQEGGGKI